MRIEVHLRIGKRGGELLNAVGCATLGQLVRKVFGVVRGAHCGFGILALVGRLLVFDRARLIQPAPLWPSVSAGASSQTPSTLQAGTSTCPPPPRTANIQTNPRLPGLCLREWPNQSLVRPKQQSGGSLCQMGIGGYSGSLSDQQLCFRVQCSPAITQKYREDENSY